MQNKAQSLNSTEPLMGNQIPIILAAVTAAAMGLYLLVSLNYYRIGFPLDDSWIHQTYARSLALAGKWEYFPGQSSAGGSTSPLWSLLLALGHFIKVDIFVWTFLLGGACLWGTATLAEWTTRHLIQGYRPAIPWVGILLACEWHLVWASVSGMETILQIFLVVLFFTLLNIDRGLTAAGLVVGLSVWVRPDGITLLMPLFISLMLAKTTLQNRVTNLLKATAGFALLFIPYLFFNLALTGTILPNTFYAKQTEYALLQQIPLYQRFYEQILQPLTGAGIFLLPALLFYTYRAIQKRDWTIISTCLWLLVYPGLYAIRLPVTYQHGRYAMPVIALFLLIGSLAAVEWFTAQGLRSQARLIRNVWALSTGLICALFLLIGASTYARDVAFIESEMVNTARWVAQNIPSDELLAAHDIGALGYFGNHKIIDLAGLISPEIIPIMRDQTRLAEYMSQNNVSYLVTFPNWYPDLIKGKTVKYTSGSNFGKVTQGENMTVFRWK